jgi:citronellyl-CoA dehydrogenase
MLLSSGHKELIRKLEAYIAEAINPHVDFWESSGHFPIREILRQMGQLELLGQTKPEKFGGLGRDASFSIVMAEQLGSIRCGGIPLSIGIQTDMATPALAAFGSDALCEQFLRPTIRGELISCIAISEPGAGSDTSSIDTFARKDGDDYILSGEKTWILNGFEADWACVLAGTFVDDAAKRQSLFCIPLTERGVEKFLHQPALGMRCVRTSRLVFDDVRVPSRFRIGDDGLGSRYQHKQFQVERLWGAASLLRAMERVIDETIAHCRNRIVFGRPLISNQAIQFELAELSSEIELLRSLVYRAADLVSRNEDAARLATMAKLKAGRLSRRVADTCLQFWGALGYTVENSVNRAYRDFRLSAIGGGADEVMLAILSRQLGLSSTI